MIFVIRIHLAKRRKENQIAILLIRATMSVLDWARAMDWIPVSISYLCGILYALLLCLATFGLKELLALLAGEVFSRGMAAMLFMLGIFLPANLLSRVGKDRR